MFLLKVSSFVRCPNKFIRQVPVGESNLTVPVETNRGNYSHFMIYTRSSSLALEIFMEIYTGCEICVGFWARNDFVHTKSDRMIYLNSLQVNKR